MTSFTEFMQRWLQLTFPQKANYCDITMGRGLCDNDLIMAKYDLQLASYARRPPGCVEMA